MPRGSAKHHQRGQPKGARNAPHDDEGLRSALRAFFPPDGQYPYGEDFPGEGARTPEDHFVDGILDEIRWAAEELASSGTPKADLAAELRGIIEDLDSASQALRKISPGLDTLLGTAVDPLEAAEAIEGVANNLRKGGRSLEQYGGKLKRHQHERAIADEFAIRVLRFAKACGVHVSGRGTNAYEDYGEATKLLKIAGAGAGIKLGLPTWRDVVLRAMKSTGDLQSEARRARNQPSAKE
jgi:hypothetical protein